MIFVLSTGRSGTKTMTRLLNQVEGIAAFHEPGPQFKDEIERCIKKEMAVAELAELMRRNRRPAVEGREYAECSLVTSYALPALREAFPEARFIWLVRDGREVVASHLQLAAMNPELQQELNYEIFQCQFGLDWFGEMTREEWLALPELDKCCWYWAKTHMFIKEGLKNLPGQQWIQLHLEHLNEEKALLKERFNLPIERTLKAPVVNQGFSRYGRKRCGWREWTPENRETFIRVCGPMMDELYPEWRDAGGNWQAARAADGRSRAARWIQERLRGAFYSQNPVSKWILAQGDRFPRLRDWTKRLIGR